MNHERLSQLAQAHLDGCLSDEQFIELQQLLESDSNLRAEYVKLAHLDSALRDADVVEFSKPKENVFNKGRVYSIAAAIGFLMISTWMLSRFVPQADAIDLAHQNSPTTHGIAVISAEADAVWENGGNQLLRQGDALVPGRIILRQGLAQIDFYGGASVTLSGPAEIELISSNSAVLHSGRLKADVPPAARGFEIRTVGMLIEDLGTSFGLAINEDDEADLIVFDGEVRTTGSDGKPVSIFGGDAVRLKEGGAKSKATDDVGDFPTITDVLAGSGDREKSRYAKWKQASLLRRSDPRLVAYYDFEKLTNVSRRLKNRATPGLGSELDGGIVGARVAKGRWAQKTALDFRREGDRVRFQIPGKFESLTIYAWIRIDALDRYFNSLFLTDNYDPNEFHWQISKLGALHFATSPNGVENLPKNNRRFYSDVFWNPEKSGQWFLLATTVDRQSGVVAHYIDGEKTGFSGGENMKKLLPKMRIGGADLGNWTDPIQDGSIRTLNGRVDEFAIYSAALSAAEIEEIYEIGKP